MKQALVSLFPDIGLDLLKFRSGNVISFVLFFYMFLLLLSSLANIPAAQNGAVEKSKIFFENYALANRFDLKNPQNWYSQSLRRIISSKV